jgi:hypothetical protein
MKSRLMRIEAGDPGVGVLSVPGPFDEGGMMVIDFAVADRVPGVDEFSLTVIGVHALDVGFDIVGDPLLA